MWILLKLIFQKDEFCGNWNFRNVNLVKIDILEMWILWKMKFQKCEFSENWDFQYVNFWIKSGFLPQRVVMMLLKIAKVFLWRSERLFPWWCNFFLYTFVVLDGANIVSISWKTRPQSTTPSSHSRINLGSELRIKNLYVGGTKNTHWGKNPIFIQKFPWFWCYKKVNFVKIEISEMWILWKMEFSICDFLDKMWIFAPSCSLLFFLPFVQN